MFFYGLLNEAIELARSSIGFNLPIPHVVVEFVEFAPNLIPFLGRKFCDLVQNLGFAHMASILHRVRGAKEQKRQSPRGCTLPSWPNLLFVLAYS
jgi:hypothetical protein